MRTIMTTWILCIIVRIKSEHETLVHRPILVVKQVLNGGLEL